MLRTAGIVITFFVIVEILIRYFNPQIQPLSTDSRLIQDSVYTGFPALKPFAQGKSMKAWRKVAANGFWEDVHKPKAKAAILFLGDSVTMGIGVTAQQSFAGIFNKKLPDTLKVLNPSWLGYNYQVYPQILQRYLKTEEIQAVYLFWCWNDIIPLNTAENFAKPAQKNLIYFFNEHYFTFQWLKKHSSNRPKSYHLHDTALYHDKNVNYRKSVSKLQKMALLCEQNGIPFRVFLLPYQYPLSQNLTQSTNRWAKTLAKAQIEVYDLSSAIRKPFEERYLYGDGIHFSTLGHQEIAHAVEKIHLQLYQSNP
jgi:lysophospholipase L1-like esterase